MGIIYIITNNITNKSYVGQTSYQLSKRWKQHCYFAEKRNCQTYLSNSIRKHGSINFTPSVLEETVDLHNREKYWIKELKTYKHGYNLTEGGEGTVGYKWKDESRKKFSIIKSGIPLTEEHKNNLSLSLKGRKVWNKGIPGHKPTPETRKKLSECRYKKVEQFLLDGTSLCSYNSILEASSKTNTNKNSIIKVCRGKRNKAGGYMWKYAEEYNV